MNNSVRLPVVDSSLSLVLIDRTSLEAPAAREAADGRRHREAGHGTHRVRESSERTDVVGAGLDSAVDADLQAAAEIVRNVLDELRIEERTVRDVEELRVRINLGEFARLVSRDLHRAKEARHILLLVTSLDEEQVVDRTSIREVPSLADADTAVEVVRDELASLAGLHRTIAASELVDSLVELRRTIDELAETRDREVAELDVDREERERSREILRDNSIALVDVRGRDRLASRLVLKEVADIRLVLLERGELLRPEALADHEIRRERDRNRSHRDVHDRGEDTRDDEHRNELDLATSDAVDRLVLGIHEVGVASNGEDRRALILRTAVVANVELVRDLLVDVQHDADIHARKRRSRAEALDERTDERHVVGEAVVALAETSSREVAERRREVALVGIDHECSHDLDLRIILLGDDLEDRGRTSDTVRSEAGTKILDSGSRRESRNAGDVSFREQERSDVILILEHTGFVIRPDDLRNLGLEPVLGELLNDGSEIRLTFLAQLRGRRRQLQKICNAHRRSRRRSGRRRSRSSTSISSNGCRTTLERHVIVHVSFLLVCLLVATQYTNQLSPHYASK